VGNLERGFCAQAGCNNRGLAASAASTERRVIAVILSSKGWVYYATLLFVYKNILFKYIVKRF
jgi:hypothetical protein